MNIGFVLLSDHSEAVNGKLYLTGGGWNVLRLPELPHEWSFHIGLGIDVAWHETNDPHELVVTIQDPDGVELGEGLTANFETGRPPGMPPGQEQRLVMSIGATASFADRRPPRRRRPGQRRGARPRPLLPDGRRARGGHRLGRGSVTMAGGGADGGAGDGGA